MGRALYLPKCWTDDPQRMAAAGVPGGTGFATKPALARELIGRALDAGVPAAWVAGDEVYGSDHDHTRSPAANVVVPVPIASRPFGARRIAHSC